jgi:hypothetical protein
MKGTALNGYTNQPHLTAASVPSGINGTGNDTQLFEDSRTVIKQIFTSTASAQRIVFPQLAQNISYFLQFYSPKVDCSPANSIEASITQKYGQQYRTFLNTTYLDYFAFIPDLTRVNGYPLNESNVGYDFGMSASHLPDASAASNELWIMSSSYANGSNCSNPRDIEYQYTVCKLFNASYGVRVSVANGIPSITDVNTTLITTVPYPAQGNPPPKSDLDQHSYAAVMRAISDLLIGSLSSYDEPSTDTSPGTNVRNLDTKLELTALLGSPNNDVFFDRGKTPKTCPPSFQRQDDMNKARNRTLAELIPELSFNFTISLTSNPSLA